eukprot:6185179-Pleurochrysis_carterae.AAC.4
MAGMGSMMQPGGLARSAWCKRELIAGFVPAHRRRGLKRMHLDLYQHRFQSCIRSKNFAKACQLAFSEYIFFRLRSADNTCGDWHGYAAAVNISVCTSMSMGTKLTKRGKGAYSVRALPDVTSS